jgi:hypothetical protein
MKRTLEEKLAELKKGLESLTQRQNETLVSVWRQEGAIMAVEQLIEEIDDNVVERTAGVING